MNNLRILSDLGMAQKASLVVSGEEMVLESIRKARARIVFLARDAGPSTTKRVTDKASFYKVPLIHALSGDELSHAIGKSNRKVLAVTDARFARLLENAANE